MIKKVFFLVALTAGYMRTHSQTALTYSAHSPQNNDVYTVSNSSYVNPGSTGTGQTWNFSSAPVTGSSSFTVAPSSSIPLGSNFPNASTAITTGGASDCFEITSGSINYYGGTFTPGMLGAVYSDPEKRLQFPFSYLNSFSDSFYATETISGNTTYRYGYVTVTADGEGTLITPAGTYSNVLRLRRNISWTDSTSANIVTYSGDYYSWYSVSSRYPLAEMWSVTGTAGSSFGSRYLTGVTQGISGLQDESGIVVFPNPCDEKLFVSSGHTKDINTVRIYDINGKNVFERDFKAQNAQATFELSFNAPAGIYFLSISDGNSILTRKIVKQ